MRRVVSVAVLLLLIALGVWLWPRPGVVTPVARPAPASGEARSPAALPLAATADPRASLDTDYPIVAPLNRADSTIARDLETLTHVLDAWRSNFPHEGNPVGENTDITAALTGANRLGLVLIPKWHPAIDARGELCDRWGVPFRFHQLSGTRMELRSAGPDRKFATADDAIWHPPE
jgi:hypothetical protein